MVAATLSSWEYVMSALRSRVTPVVAAVALTLLATPAHAQKELYRDPNNLAMWKHAPAEFKVKLATSKGDIIIAVHRKWAPRGADRFYNLVRTGFYNDTYFTRVRTDIAQWGLHGDKNVTKKWKGAVIPDDKAQTSNLRGRVAYSFITPGGRSTQLFISLKDNVNLDAENFAPFGEVVKGMEVADSLYNGYGENSGGGMRGGKQGTLEEGGNELIRRLWPKLDYIKKATII